MSFCTAPEMPWTKTNIEAGSAAPTRRRHSRALNYNQPEDMPLTSTSDSLDYARTRRSTQAGSRSRSRSSSGRLKSGGLRWRNRAPMGDSEREATLRRCGPSAFLVPEYLLYPVVTKNGCKKKPQGVDAALRRARINVSRFPNDPVHRMALHKAEHEAEKMGLYRTSSRRRRRRSTRK